MAKTANHTKVLFDGFLASCPRKRAPQFPVGFSGLFSSATWNLLRVSAGGHMATQSDEYIVFDEVGDVLASVDVIAVVAPTLGDNPLRWKWVILAAHSAMQGAMVCAYADSA